MTYLNLKISIQISVIECIFVTGQVLGKVPTISVDKTDGCQIYLSPEALDVEIVSSKSSEMNVLVPKGNGDYVSIYCLPYLPTYKVICLVAGYFILFTLHVIDR